MILGIVLTVVVPTLLVAVATIVFGRRSTVSSGEHDSDSVSFVGGVLSALFTVVLAFYVVFAWQVGDDIDNNATAESNALVNVFWQADVVPKPQRTELQELVRSYASRVSYREWELLAQGRTDPRVGQLIREMRENFMAVSAENGSLAIAREQGLLAVRQLGENHNARVDDLTDRNMFNTALLVATIFGAVLMVAFPLLAGLSLRPANVGIMTLLGIALGATLFLTMQLTNPLAGLFAAEPDVFLNVLDRLPRPT